MLIAAHNMITWREEEWPMRVTILEDTFTDAQGSYQLPPKKTEKALAHTFLRIIWITELAAQPKGFASPSQD